MGAGVVMHLCVLEVGFAVVIIIKGIKQIYIYIYIYLGKALLYMSYSCLQPLSLQHTFLQYSLL